MSWERKLTGFALLAYGAYVCFRAVTMKLTEKEKRDGMGKWKSIG